MNDNLRLSDIYPECVDTSSISIVNYNNDKLKPMCIFGVFSNQLGMRIREEMLSWLLPLYNVIEVRQKTPGVLFEYPALRFAQWFLLNNDVNYCLYVHTKGAANNNSVQRYVREMWRLEFGSENRRKNYVELCDTDEPTQACPYVGPNGAETWFNGFFANKAAFTELGDIEKYENRYLYECLFNPVKDRVKIKALLKDNINSGDVVANVIGYVKSHNHRLF